MQSAVESLERGVEQLFAVSARQRTAAVSTTASSTSPAPSRLAPHPLCECLTLRAPPPDWRSLRRFPVLKRHVLSSWHARCEQFERGLGRRQRRQQRALDTPAAAQSAAFARRRALVAQSVRLLCIRLLQCGLLHAHETAFVQLLVAHTLSRGLGDALLLSYRRSGGARNVTGTGTGSGSGSSTELLELPLRTRLLLLREVLVQLSHPPTGAQDAHDTRDRDASVRQRLVEDVCSNLQDDVLEALAKPRGGPTMLTRSDERACDFCASDEALYSLGLPVLNAPARFTPWPELEALAKTIRELLDARASDRLRDDINKNDDAATAWPARTTLAALATLHQLLTRADVVTRLATRPRGAETDLRLPRPLFNDDLVQSHWRLAGLSYEQLCWRTVAACAREAESKVNLSLWETVWKNEWARLSQASPPTVVFAHEIIAQCATADVFAWTPHAGADATFNPTLPGFQVVCAILRALRVTVFRAVLLVDQALAKTQKSTGTQRRTVGPQTTAVASMCREYLAHLLSSDELERERSADESVAGAVVAADATGADTESAFPANGEQLRGLFHALYTVFADTSCRSGVGARAGAGLVRPQPQSQSCCRQWDRLLRWYVLHETRRGTADDRMLLSAVGLQSLQGLACCCSGALAADAAVDDGSNSFRIAFAQYAQDRVRGVIAENGRTIASSDGEWREPLVRSSADAVAVEECVTSIAESFGARWVSELAGQLLRCQLHNRWRMRSAEISLRLQRGLSRFFFPALAAVVRTSSSSPLPAASSVLRERETRESEEDRFFTVIAHATDLFKADCELQDVVTAALRFCTDWDAFQLRSTARVDTSRLLLAHRERQYGRACFPRMNLFVDVLQMYESESVLASESNDVLRFLGDVLQSTTNCPPALEGRLFLLLTRIKRRLETLSRGVQGDASPPKPRSEGEVLGPQRVGPISHTDNALADYIRRLHSGTVSEVRDAIERLKSDATTLDELVQHVLRWADLLQQNDSDAAFGKETKLGFTVLCSRLVCWLPDESVHEIRQLTTPLDHEIVDALAAFAESFDDDDVHDNPHVPGAVYSTTLGGASVRIEFLVRAFVSSNIVPDLCELTDVVMHAIIGCTSASARDALLKLAQRIAGCLLVEVAIETVRLSLSIECLQYVERPATQALAEDDNDDDDAVTVGSDREQGNSRRSVNRLSNALSIVGLSSVLFQRSDVMWSMSLFDEQAVRHWLLCFFDCMVYAEQSRALTPIDELLSSLEFLLTMSADGDRMTAHSYFLTALLCTASFPQSRVPLALWSDFDVSLEEVARALVSKLSTPHAGNGRHEVNESDESAILFVQTDPLRVTRAQVLEAKLELVSSTHLVPLDPMLNQRLRGEDRSTHAEAETERVVVRFATWLTSAVIYSQSVAAALTSSSESSSSPSAVGHAWEQVFTDYIVYLYLSLEFGSRPIELLTAWVRVWVRMSVEHANGSSGCSFLLLLLPFQQKLFARLGASAPRQASSGSTAFAAPWSLVFACLDQILDSVAATPEAAETAIVVLDDTVDKFELVNVATFGCVHANVSIGELVACFEAACVDDRLGTLTALERMHVLKHPLELLAFFHISGGRTEDTSHALERALTALRSATRESESESDWEALDSDTGAALSEEMASFWFEWTRMLQLKYAYLAPARCELFIHAATEALSAT